MIQRNNGEIVVFKMTSGEELVARIVSQDSSGYHVTNPLVLITTETGVQFAPFMMMINPKHLVFIPSPVITGTPSDSMISAYESATGAIVVPPKPSIILG